MAFLDTTFARGAFKKLNASAHLGNNRDPANESTYSAPLVAAHQAMGEIVNATPATAVSDGTVELVTLDLTVIAGTNNLAYEAKFQSGYSGYFGAGAASKLMRLYTFALPRAWGSQAVPPNFANVDSAGWIPIVKTSGAVVIAESNPADWYFDTFAGIITAETAFVTDIPATIKTYIYTGDTIATRLTAKAGKYSTTFNATSVTVTGATHGLGADLIVQLYDASTPRKAIMADITVATNGDVVADFNGNTVNGKIVILG